jgi:16S rRNA G966 N2-methylase RsmD
MTELSTLEAQELERCEAAIEAGLQTVIEMGVALRAIRDGRLYRATHATFEEYFRARWGMVASRARQLCLAADTFKNVEGVTNVTPANEAQTRPLLGLAPDQQREAWALAVETAPGGKVTAEHVKAVVEVQYATRSSLTEVLAQAPAPCGPDYDVMQGDAEHLAFPDQSFDLVFGSPPYAKQRLYLENGEDLRIARDWLDWVQWMLRVTTEALRVSRGLVCWVVSGYTEDRSYRSAPEGLLYEWCKRGGSSYRPVFWSRPGIPGSGGDQWYASRIEYVLAFKRPGPLPWADPLANGHPPVYGPGGEMSYRNKDGSRVNQRGNSAPAHTSNHEGYQPPAIANPGNLISTSGGGGHLGSDLAHLNEAPFPEELAAWFIRSHCRPGGRVLDPFGGSGSTVAAALREGRRGVSVDLRESQCRLARQRLASSPEAQTQTP